MGWLSLYKAKSFESGMKMTMTANGFKRKPLIDKFGKRQLRCVFNMAGLNYFYKKSDIIPNPNSPYHVLPKGVLKKEKEYINKVSKLRAGIATALDKTEKYRQERVNKRRFTGLDKQMHEAYIYLAGKNISALTTEKLDEDDINYQEEAPKKKNTTRMVSQFTKLSKSYRDMGKIQRELIQNYMESKYIRMGEDSKKKDKKKKAGIEAVNQTLTEEEVKMIKQSRSKANTEKKNTNI